MRREIGFGGRRNWRSLVKICTKVHAQRRWTGTSLTGEIGENSLRDNPRLNAQFLGKILSSNSSVSRDKKAITNPRLRGLQGGKKKKKKKLREKREKVGDTEHGVESNIYRWRWLLSGRLLRKTKRTGGPVCSVARSLARDLVRIRAWNS